MQIKAIDLHAHYATEEGYLYKGPESIALAEKIYRTKVVYKTVEEMAGDFRKTGVKVFLDYGFTMDWPLDEVKKLHDITAQMLKDHPDVIVGAWAAIDPKTGLEGLRELERCLNLGFTGFLTNPPMIGFPPSDRIYYPFYEICIEAKAPVLICVGYTAWGAGHPGGKGVRIEYAHPRYVDEVAATFPDLTIIAGRPAWPWQSEMIAVLLHKPNVWNELHGWSPKYFTDDLKWEIGHRLQDKIMFGSDYPLFSYERLFKDWESLGYSQEVLEKVFWKNAQRFFEGLGKKIL